MGLLFSTEGTRRIINTLNSAFDGPTPKGQPAMGLDLIRTYAQSGGANYNQTLNDLVNNVGSQWVPGALAMNLDLLPYDQGSGNGNDGNGPSPPNNPNPLNRKAAKRWYHFLTQVLAQPKTAADGTITYSAAFTTLQSALGAAILNNALDSSGNNRINIVRVSFDHVEIDENTAATGTAPPGNAPPNVVIYDAPLPYDSTSTPPNPLPYLRHITLFTVRVPQKHAGAAYNTSPVFKAPWNSDY